MQERGIEPWVTLFHWDTPVWAGDFLDRDMAQRLVDYAEIVVERFADRIKRWMVVNEPNTVAVRGYGAGIDAPGYASTPKMLKAIHHLNLSIGLMTRATRLHMSAGSIVARSTTARRPSGEQQYRESGCCGVHGQRLELELPRPAVWARLSHVVQTADGSFRQDGDMDIIATELDFLGVNYYSSLLLQDDAGAPVRRAGRLAGGDGEERLLSRGSAGF